MFHCLKMYYSRYSGMWRRKGDGFNIFEEFSGQRLRNNKAVLESEKVKKFHFETINLMILYTENHLAWDIMGL